MEPSNTIFKSKKVLDHGFVELVDILGNDQAIVNAARTSYDKGTKKVSSNRQLIRYLMRHRHMGPFEFGEAVFRIRCPLFVARQWFRHRTGSYNEASLRYSEARDEFYIPNPEWITSQDRRNRQARTSNEISNSQEIHDQMVRDAQVSLNSYSEYIEKGVAREIARINIPLSYYTTFCFKSDLRNLMNFFSLRLDPHAQIEIRVYAKEMLQMVEEYFPFTIEAWRNYHMDSIHFSGNELLIMKDIFERKDFDIVVELEHYFAKISEKDSISDNEKKEFIDKFLKLLGKESTLNYLE